MVQIIPKQFHQKKSKIGQVLVLLSLVLIGVVLAGYFILKSQTAKANSSLEDVKSQLSNIQTQQDVQLQGKIFEYRKKIKDIKLLLSQRKRVGDFLNFLSSFVHPNLYFTELNLDLDKGEATLEGVSPDFASIGQQIDIFQKQDFIQKAELMDVSLEEASGIKFTLDVSLFAKDEQTKK